MSIVGMNTNSNITYASHQLNNYVDSIILPYQQKLEQFAEADTDIGMLSDLNIILGNLKNMNDDVANLITKLTESNYLKYESLDDAYTSTEQFLSMLYIYIGQIVSIPSAEIDNKLYSTSYQMLSNIIGNFLFNSTLSSHMSNINSLLNNKISSYIASTGTGLDSTTENAIYNRAKARILYDANRNVRRITNELMKRLPYSGELVDALQEADMIAVNAMSDVNNKIIEEQARLTYQATIDRIQKAIEHEKIVLDDYLNNKELMLKAYTEYDNLEILKYKASLDYAKTVFDIRNEGLKHASIMDRQLRDYKNALSDRALKARGTYDELFLKNYWNYYEMLIKIYLGFVESTISLLKSKVYSAEQLSFENYLAMAKVIAEGQLTIAGIIANVASNV